MSLNYREYVLNYTNLRYIYIYMLPPPSKIRAFWLYSEETPSIMIRAFWSYSERTPSNMTQLIRKNPSIPQHCLETLGTHISYNIMCMQCVLTLMYVSMHMVHG